MAHPDRGGTSPPPSALHEESGRNLSEVADDLTISTSKLSRLENAQGRPQPRDVRDLIRYYGIEDAPLDVSLRRWVNAAQRQGGWTDVDDELLESRLGRDTHLRYEADATRGAHLQPAVLVGPVADNRVRNGDLPRHGRSFGNMRLLSSLKSGLDGV